MEGASTCASAPGAGPPAAAAALAALAAFLAALSVGSTVMRPGTQKGKDEKKQRRRRRLGEERVPLWERASECAVGTGEHTRQFSPYSALAQEKAARVNTRSL